MFGEHNTTSCLLCLCLLFDIGLSRLFFPHAYTRTFPCHENLKHWPTLYVCVCSVASSPYLSTPSSFFPSTDRRCWRSCTDCIKHFIKDEWSQIRPNNNGGNKESRTRPLCTRTQCVWLNVTPLELSVRSLFRRLCACRM